MVHSLLGHEGQRRRQRFKACDVDRLIMPYNAIGFLELRVLFRVLCEICYSTYRGPEQMEKGVCVWGCILAYVESEREEDCCY